MRWKILFLDLRSSIRINNTTIGVNEYCRLVEFLKAFYHWCITVSYDDDYKKICVYIFEIKINLWCDSICSKAATLHKKFECKTHNTKSITWSKVMDLLLKRRVCRTSEKQIPILVVLNRCLFSFPYSP